MPRVTHFEIHADDPERALAFYKSLFGWRFDRWEGSPTPYWLITTGEDAQPGINGGLLKRPVPVQGKGANAFVCTVDVPSIDEYVDRGLKLGGTLALEKMEIPGMGWVAYLTDTDDNVFGLFQAA